MSSHKSKSGPVRVIARFAPEPLTPDQQLARLRHKLVLIEDRIAARDTFPRLNRRQLSLRDASEQMASLILQRDETHVKIASLESGE